MKDTKKLRVATYNIQFGINTEEVITSIEKLALDGAHIICIQEIINNLPQELIVHAVLKHLGKNWQASYHMGTENSQQSIGTAIFWDKKTLKLTEEGKILLPRIKKFDLHEKFFYWVIGAPAL